MSKQKQKGTKFETECAHILRAQGFNDIRRVALAGVADMGDLHSVKAGAIWECKNHKKLTPSLFRKWVLETERERKNAGVANAYLVVGLHGKGTKNSLVFGSSGDFLGLLGNWSKHPLIGDKETTKTVVMLAFGGR